MKVARPRHSLLKCLSQLRIVSGHVFVLRVSILTLSTILFFWNCSEGVFHFIIPTVKHHIGQTQKHISENTKTEV
jgi:hypothetical protein